MHTGEKLRAQRIRKGMTLQQVGDLVGVGKSTVRKWETGIIRNMGRDKILALALALDLQPSELLQEDSIEIDSIETEKPASSLIDQELTSDERRLLSAWRLADPMWRRIALYNLESRVK